MSYLQDWIALIYPHGFPYTSPHSRTETLCQADASPDTRGAGTGGSWWLNNTGDSVALLLAELALGTKGSQDWRAGAQAVVLASML